MATAREISESGRDACVSAVIEGLESHIASDAAGLFDLATTAVDALVGATQLFPAERWDEDCHDCEAPIRDHRVDGRCPDGAKAQFSNPTPGDSS